jgi:DNA polymerase-3 subunit delta'
LATNEIPTTGYPASPELYPWHDRLWLMLAPQIDRLPHALLLHGRPGLGKHSFAFRLAQLLVCTDAQGGSACGKCRGCQLFAAGTHPDLFFIGLMEEAKSIAIDQIRELGEFLSLKPHSAKHKVVVISPAEAMNPNAANSLLKMLEEPPLGSILLLVTSHPAQLPATVRSRCSHLLFTPPDRQTGLVWMQSRCAAAAPLENLLDMAGGSPLLAESLLRDGFVQSRGVLLQDLESLYSGHADPIACAARWKRLGVKPCLNWLYGFVADLIKVEMEAPASSLTNPEVAPNASRQRFKYKISVLYNLVDTIHEYNRHLSSPLDELMILEDVLICWARMRRLQ